ncbi:MAG: hypothetical protein IJ155_02040 [Prevotella sp.]|nr:hypothetical protein [Prevotella sp.]
MNKSPFRANLEIKDPKFLFGRKEELKKLCDFAEGLLQVEIIGARRFGKTCLLKSFITQQKENENRKTYPVYIDINSDSIKGTTNVYRYLTSQLVANLLIDGYIEEGELTIDDFTFRPNKKWNKVYKQLGEIEDEIDQIGIFEEAIEIFSKQLGQTILLVFDEYEKAVDAFDNINGLMHIRKMTNDSNSMSFWIVGASPWKKYILTCNQDLRGSGVFNGITFNVDVCPLRKEDFHDMWNYECSLIADDTKRKHLESLWENVFASSGGVPCFAKEIGGFTYIEDNYPQYYRLRNHFVELEKNLTESEIKCLRLLSISPQEYKASEKPESIVALEQYGFICADENNRYYVASRFFADFIRAGVYDDQLKDVEDSTIDSMVKKIEDVTYSINDKWKSLHGTPMFDPTIDILQLYRALRAKCDCREKAPDFVNSIYLLYWEGSKENESAGAKIPDTFKWTIFRKAMDRIRHTFGKAHQQDKLSTNFGQIDKGAALREIYGETTEPQTPMDWLRFQECMLSRYLQELTDLYECICNGSINRELVNGEVFDGIIVEIPKQDGRIFKNVQCPYSTYPLMIRNSRLNELMSGSKVKFTATREVDRYDATKTFWVASEVHLQ